MSANDGQAGELGKIGDQVVRDAVRQVVVRCRAADVRERQHRNRRLRRHPAGPPAAAPSRRRRRRSAANGATASRHRRQARRTPPRPHRWAAQDHTIGADRPLDVLDPLLAQELQRQVELALQMVVGGAGNEHAARLRQLLEAGGDIHGVAEQVAVLLVDDVAEIDADAEADAVRLRARPARARPCPAGRARHSGPHRRRSRTRTASRRRSVDDAAMMLDDERLDELGTVRL